MRSAVFSRLVSTRLDWEPGLGSWGWLDVGDRLEENHTGTCLVTRPQLLKALASPAVTDGSSC